MRGTRAVLKGLFVLAAMVLPGLPAAAQAPAEPAAAAAEPPTCTTTTVVVKRGDVVLSTTSNTKCEEPGAKPSLNVGDVLNAPSGLLAALGAGGEELTPKNARGDWRTVEPRSQGVCHLFLLSEQGRGGYRVRATGCSAAVSRVKDWTFADGGISLFDAGGGLVARLSGYRERVVSTEIDGRNLVFER